MARGHDRAGRCVGEGLEHPSAVVDELAPRSFVALVEAGPRTPGRDRPVEAPAELALAPDPWRGFVGAAMVQPEAHGLPLAEGEPGGHPSIVDRHRDRGGQDEDVGAALQA